MADGRTLFLVLGCASSESFLQSADGYLADCKVAGSNLTVRMMGFQDGIHSVDPTLMGLSSRGQNVIHSPVARVVFG